MRFCMIRRMRRGISSTPTCSLPLQDKMIERTWGKGELCPFPRKIEKLGRFASDLWSTAFQAVLFLYPSL